MSDKTKTTKAIKIPKHPLLDVQYNLIFTSAKYPQFDHVVLSGGQHNNEWYWWFDTSLSIYHGNEWSIKKLVKNIRRHNKTTKIQLDTFLF